MAKDYYQILGVSRDADTQTIKKAYRQLAKKYHPDRNPSTDTTEEFYKIQEAYDVLTDPEERRRYDRKLEQGPHIAHDDKLNWFQNLRDIVYQHAAKKEYRRKKRKRVKRKEQQLFKHAMKVLFIPALLILGLIIGIYGYIEYQTYSQLKNEGQTTVATVYSVNEGLIGPAYAYYLFEAEGKRIYGSRQLSLRANALPVNDNGMPVRPGDTYKVRYVPKDPGNNKLLLQEPTKHQINRYHQMAKDRCVEQNKRGKNLSSVIQYCNCKLELLYNTFGVESYAFIYFQDESFANNGTHNKRSFRKFTQRTEYQKAHKECQNKHL